jgi:hypothetical protein
LLPLHRIAHGTVFGVTQRGHTHFATPETCAQLRQRSRAQQTADLVGAKRRLGVHGESSERERDIAATHSLICASSPRRSFSDAFHCGYASEHQTLAKAGGQFDVSL